jgi:1-phosphatidylinositol-4-phosphate 5-kinase
MARDIVKAIRAMALQSEYNYKEDVIIEDALCIQPLSITGEKHTFHISIYGPNVFAHLRRMLGISVASFLESWVIPKKDKGKKLWKISPGKSGSRFFYTRDGQYLYKTIHKHEAVTCCSLLYQYYMHLHQYPTSLILRMLGLIELSKKNRSTYVLICLNALPLKGLKSYFDIKGKSPKNGKPKRNVSLRLRNEKEETHFLEQIHRDVEFLKRCDVMDYSLLVGIYEPSSNSIKAVDFSGVHYVGISRSYQGVNKSNVPEIYYFTIIDCITSYRLQKKLATFFKSFIWHRKTLSTVDSSYYADRFLDYIEGELLFRNEEEKRDISKKATVKKTKPARKAKSSCISGSGKIFCFV